MLVFLGDIHGNFNYVKWYIKAHKLENCTIYQVGDFGIGFTTEFNDMNVLGNLNRFLIEKNIHLYAIRGNHDDPQFFDGHLRNHFDNLHLLADYDVIEVNGVKILGIGGAVSVDRRPRMREELMYASNANLAKKLHWHDELFVLDEEKIRAVEGIDIIVTHTAPDFCAPDNRNGFGYLVDQFASGDGKLKEDLTKERNDVTKMWNIFREKNNPDYHFYGHFHNNWGANIDGVNHKLLNINEFFEYRNWKDYEPEWEKEIK
jgi:Icc-related predicted phosphoesterase